MERYTINSSLPGLLSNSNRYKTDKGEISLLTPCEATRNTYEIFSVGEVELFEDIERYPTLEEAEARINELLL